MDWTRSVLGELDAARASLEEIDSSESEALAQVNGAAQRREVLAQLQQQRGRALRESVKRLEELLAEQPSYRKRTRRRRKQPQFIPTENQLRLARTLLRFPSLTIGEAYQRSFPAHAGAAGRQANFTILNLVKCLTALRDDPRLVERLPAEARRWYDGLPSHDPEIMNEIFRRRRPLWEDDDQQQPGGGKVVSINTRRRSPTWRPLTREEYEVYACALAGEKLTLEPFEVANFLGSRSVEQVVEVMRSGCDTVAWVLACGDRVEGLAEWDQELYDALRLKWGAPVYKTLLEAVGEFCSKPRVFDFLGEVGEMQGLPRKMVTAVEAAGLRQYRRGMRHHGSMSVLKQERSSRA